jgi:hypothetical protein
MEQPSAMRQFGFPHLSGNDDRQPIQHPEHQTLKARKPSDAPPLPDLEDFEGQKTRT